MNANVGHDLMTVLRLGPQDTSLALALFYVAYVLFDLPSNLIMTRMSPRAWMARIVFAVGVIGCCFTAVRDAWSVKLLRFLLDAGDLGQRQIFSGIRASYGEPDKLVGRNVVFIANLAPRKMRFGLSEGMILSAGFDGGALALLDADAGALPGMPVR